MIGRQWASLASTSRRYFTNYCELIAKLIILAKNHKIATLLTEVGSLIFVSMYQSPGYVIGIYSKRCTKFSSPTHFDPNHTKVTYCTLYLSRSSMSGSHTSSTLWELGDN